MRTSTGVLVGLVAMVAMFFLVRFGAYAVMGENRMFEVGTHEPSQLFILVEIISALAAALVGGLTCSKLTKATRPPITLALAVFVIGIVLVFPAMTMASKQPVAREPGGSMIEAMSTVKRPVWVAMILPVAGVVGLLAGGAIGSRGLKDPSPKKK